MQPHRFKKLDTNQTTQAVVVMQGCFISVFSHKSTSQRRRIHLLAKTPPMLGGGGCSGSPVIYFNHISS